ncbi:MATE family efflux transporter [Gallintestinimicrobium sp.]|uniref:MATE family efflux transporter n=1 Tax=Gallintestinimicrobium sp. TaxID=2981655 RepID=UPI003994211C
MEQDMTQGKPLSIILKFTLPLLVGNIFQQFYNMADTIIVGRFVGANALAAVGSTGTVMFLIIGFAQGITAGFTILTSQRYGAKDEKAVRASVANGILLSVLVTILITVVGLSTMKPLLLLMNTPEDIFADAYTYSMLICSGVVACIFYNLFSSLLRAIGNSKVPLFFLVFSACLNVVLDLLLILCFHMGVAGAAIATNISQGVSAVLCLIYIYKNVPVLCPERTQWRLSASDTAYQMRMGIPMALQFSITASGAMVMQAAINLFGSVAVAAFTAASKVQNLVTQGMMSMGQTMASYGGQNYGKGDYHRLEKGVRSALLISVIYSLLAARCSCRRSVPAPAAFPVLLRRHRYSFPDALGKNLYLHVCGLLYSAFHNFYFPKHHAGLRLQLPADDGRCSRAVCPHDHSTDRHEACKLSPRLLLRSCRMGRRGALYRIFLVIRQEKAPCFPAARGYQFFQRSKMIPHFLPLC